MSNTELVFFLVASLIMLLLTVWSMRTRDLEEQGKVKTPFLFGLLFALFFAVLATRTAPLLAQMSDAQRIAAGLAAGSLSAGSILMFARAYWLRKSIS